MRRGAVSGFSLLEMALALVVLGLLALAGVGILGPAASRRAGSASAVMRQKVHDALLEFAISNNRLPCADTDGDGYEQDGCPASSARVGWVPYATLGIDAGAWRRNLMYGVFRDSGDPASDADLAVARDRTGDGAVSLDDFRQALINAAGKPVRNSEPFATGDGAGSGPEDCAGNVVANAAFFLVSAGIDMDGDGNVFDGVNAGLAGGGGGNCFASPARRKSSLYDDEVEAVAFVTLIGRLRQEDYPSP